MSGTEYPRPRKAWGVAAEQHEDRVPRFHHRPELRRTKVRSQAVRRALKEAGV